MKKALLKDSLKQIKKTNKRFISILLMAFMGVGFFAGIRATSPDMEATIDTYFDEKNVYDINIVSTLGLTDDDIEAISALDEVQSAIGLYTEDVFLKIEDEECIVKYITYDSEINNLEVIEGNLPENDDECVIEANMNETEGVSVGDYIQISENIEDEDEEASFINTNLKVVGIVKSPLYLSKDRGTTSLGSGKVSYFIYGTKNNINSDIYTEVDITVKGAISLNTISDEYDELIENAENSLEKIKEERETLRTSEVISEANQKLDDAQKEFDEQKADAEEQIADAEQEIADGKKEIKENEQKIADSEKELQEAKNTANTEFANAEQEIADGEAELASAQASLDEGKATLEEKKTEAQAGIDQINQGIETIDTTIADLQDSKELAESVLSAISQIDTTVASLNASKTSYEEQLSTATTEEEITALNEMIAYIDSNIVSLESQKLELEAYGITQSTVDEIDAGIAECEAQKIELETQLATINAELEAAEQEIASGQAQITAGYEQIESAKAQLAEGKASAEAQFADAEKQIADAKKQIAEAKQELADGEQELEENKEEFNREIADAEAKLIDAREEVNDIENAKWYIWNRYDNTGFNSFSQDCDNIEKLGKVFPIVFFVIAILISLTTMTRMVEEERVEIGTLKALGYNKIQIMSKYIIYSLIASVVGGALGAIFGLQFFPSVIISMYEMMYDFPRMVVEFNVYYTCLGMGLITLCIVGATIYTANKELNSTPAEMMRPKAPKPGKRVLLERVPFIWNRLSFTQKVTLRNMFRYKKKFLMTVIGICGCTALILAGFGLKDSISGIMDYQYVDLYKYDMMIGLKSTLTEEEISSLISDLENKDEIEDCTEMYAFTGSAESEEDKEDMQVMVVKDIDTIDEFIKLKDVDSGEKLLLNDDEVIITDKLAQLLDVNVGDEFTIIDSDDNEYVVKVGAITEHYISHYVYMTETLFEKLHGEEISSNILLVEYSNEISEDEEDVLSEELLLNSKISSITLTSYLITTMDDTLSAMNFVVYVLIISAGLLAFIVLFNLSNINISERIRELATIKVLGFYDKEVYDYVTREIVLLTIIGIFFGLIFGYILDFFILGTCEIGILRFKREILVQSYIFSIIITAIFTAIINFITYFSLKKIDMIESLKSIE